MLTKFLWLQSAFSRRRVICVSYFTTSTHVSKDAWIQRDIDVLACKLDPGLRVKNPTPKNPNHLALLRKRFRVELQSRIFDLGRESLCNLSECGSPVRPPSLLGGSHARKRHSSIFVANFILQFYTKKLKEGHFMTI